MDSTELYCPNFLDHSTDYVSSFYASLAGISKYSPHEPLLSLGDLKDLKYDRVSSFLQHSLFKGMDKFALDDSLAS